MYSYSFKRPSEIYFSQESINSYFDVKSAHANIKIGETLDQLCDGIITVSDIPIMKVVLKDGKYFTEDNRRLWIFRQLEKLGKCYEIKVLASDNYRTMFRYDQKFTTSNGGINVTVRGSPGGRWYKKASRIPDKVKSYSTGNRGTERYGSPISTASHRSYSNAPPMGTDVNIARRPNQRRDKYDTHHGQSNDTPVYEQRPRNDDTGLAGMLLFGAAALVCWVLFGRYESNQDQPDFNYELVNSERFDGSSLRDFSLLSGTGCHPD